MLIMSVSRSRVESMYWLSSSHETSRLHRSAVLTRFAHQPSGATTGNPGRLLSRITVGCFRIASIWLS